MAFNAGGVDYSGYIHIYQISRDLTYNGVEYLYHLACYLGNILSLDLLSFDIIRSTLGLALLYYIIFKHTPKPSIVLSLCMLFPMVDFIIQKRCFISAMISIAAFIILAEKKYKKKEQYLQIFIYIFLCLVSGGFHNVGYVYLLCLPIKFMTLKQLQYCVYVLIVVSFVMLPVFPKIMSMFFSQQKVHVYFEVLEYRLSFWKAIIFMMLHFIYFILHTKIYQGLKSKSTSDVFLIKLNYIMLIFIPLYCYSSNFIRIYRDILPLFYIEFSKLFVRPLCKNNQLLIKLAYILWAFAFFIFAYIAAGTFGFDILIKNTIFEENYLLKLLFGTNM